MGIVIPHRRIVHQNDLRDSASEGAERQLVELVAGFIGEHISEINMGLYHVTD